MITVYSVPECGQCEATKRVLNRAGMPYTEVDLSRNREQLDRLKALGFKAAPVVETPLGTWSGFRPDKLAALTRATPKQYTSIQR